MIRPLRTFHFASVLVLGFGLSVLLVSVGTLRNSPAQHLRVSTLSAQGVRSRNGLFRAQRMGVDPREVTLYAETSASAPDPLVYWTAQSEPFKGIDSATLLGTLSEGKPYAVPEGKGILVIYSLPENRVIDAVDLGGSQ